MPDRPYTDDDLRAEAAREVKYTLDNVDTDGLLEASTYDLNGGRWYDLGEGDWRAALQGVDGLVEGAADVSEWAVNLGADGLEPLPEQMTAETDRGPLFRLHFAVRPDMSDEARRALVEGIAREIAKYV